MEAEPAEKPAPETVAGVKLELEAPGSYAERWDVASALRDAVAREAPQETYVHLFAAALALCWPRLRRYLAKERIEYGADLRRYGTHTIDFLAKQPGATDLLVPEIIAAGRVAQRLCDQGLLTKAHIEEAEGFSPAPGASSSSSSSRSKPPGAESQDGSAH